MKLLMRVLVSVCVAAITIAPARGQSPSPAESLGFHGPIRSQLMTSRTLAPDPRKGAIRLSFARPLAWIAFDEKGRPVETAARLDAKNQPQEVVRHLFDPQGRESGSSDAAGSLTKMEYVSGDSGPTELRTTVDGVVVFRSEIQYDAAGRQGRTVAYGKDGKVVSISESRYDAAGRLSEWRVSDADGTLQTDYQDDFDRAGHWVSRTWLDADGKTLSSFVFTPDGHLTSWWQAPGAAEQTIGFNDAKGGTTTMYTLSGGHLLTQTDSHPGHSTDTECDSMEIRDENGKIVERLAFSYQRDAQGNWTRRVVTVWDAVTSAMIPVEEDERALTYYDSATLYSEVK